MSGAARTRSVLAAPRSGAASPRPVTRGESLPDARSSQAAKVDWVHATFDRPVMSFEALIAMLGRLMGRPLRGAAGPGRFGFNERIDLEAGVGSRFVAVGCLAFGGESQRGRVMLQLTGSGCGLVEDWDGFRELLEGLGAKLTRLDLAVDFLEGEYTVDDAVHWAEVGLFTSQGRAPSTSVAGDWLGGVDGRTLYVGRATNGKLLRVYEKGRQLGQAESDWVRFEVQFGARDRIIPLRALTDRDSFFAGAYPALVDLVEAAAERIPTDQAQAEASMGHLMRHLRRCYGRVLDTALTFYGFDYSELVEAVRVTGIPRRLTPSGAESGTTAARVIAAMEN